MFPTLDVTGPRYEEALRALGLSARSAASVAKAWPHPGSLATAAPGYLKRHGVSPAQTRRLRAALDLAGLVAAPFKGPLPTGPAAVVGMVGPSLAMAEQEVFAVVVLGQGPTLLGISVVALGSVSTVHVLPREVFRDAIRTGATSIVVVHNHPSGNPEPSDADHLITARLVEVGIMIGIEVLDHIIIGRGGRFVSLDERGLMPR